MDGWMDRQKDRAGSLGHTSVASPFAIPYSTWGCGRGSALEPEHFRVFHAVQPDPGRMDGEERGFRLGLERGSSRGSDQRA